MPSVLTKSVVSVAALALVGRSRHIKQYTRWNLLLVALSRLAPSYVPPECVLLNSATTLLGFQHGATDDTKQRLIEHHHGLHPLSFLALDFSFHTMPALLCAAWVGQARLRLRHVALVYAWFATYYITVVGGLDCTAQYVRYPWWRQVLAAVAGPLAFRIAWNRSRVAWFVIAALYVKEWYDLNDSQQRPRTQAPSPDVSQTDNSAAAVVFK